MRAEEVYQAHLDATSEAMWQEDFASLAVLLCRPHAVTAKGETRIFETEQEVVDGARIFRDGIRQLGATAYHRVTISAVFATGRRDTIYGRHRVFVLRGGSYVIDPYESDMKLVLDGNEWRAKEILLHMSDAGMAAIRPLQCLPPNPKDSTSRDDGAS